MTSPTNVLLTGAAGGVGTFLKESLPGYGYTLRLSDIAPVDGAPDALMVDLGDRAAVREAVRGMDAVVHLGGISVEDTFDNVLAANIEGAYNLYEAVRAEGVRRVVLASSNHVVGFAARPEHPQDGTFLLPVETALRPDTFYGVSKCFGEALASLYADKYGVETVSVRIGSCFARPRNTRMLETWLSPADCARLVHAALTAPDVRHTVVYGTSANTRGWWDLAPARALGFEPQDDSEAYAAEVLAEHGELVPGTPEHSYLGGAFTSVQPDSF